MRRRVPIQIDEPQQACHSKRQANHGQGNDCVIELAAEQIADLLWECYLSGGDAESMRSPKSKARRDATGSS
jgi:hypothetical protein